MKTTKPSKEGIGGGDSIFQGYLSGKGRMPCEFGIGRMDGERERERQTDRHKRQMTALIPPFLPSYLGRFIISSWSKVSSLFSRVFRSSLSKLTPHTPKFRTKSGKEIKFLSWALGHHVEKKVKPIKVRKLS